MPRFDLSCSFRLDRPLKKLRCRWATVRASYYIESQSFPRTALEFSANPARSRTIGWPTSFSCYRYRPGEIRISGSKSRPCRRALPLVTIFSVTSLFSLSSSLPFSLSSLLLSLFLPCLPFPSFFSFFHSVLPLVYASCLTMTYARIHAPEWNCSRSEKCF